MLLACVAIAGGCGSSKPKSSAQIAAEEAETIPIGRAFFIRLAPQTQSPVQRRILTKLTKGHWLQNGFFIPAGRVEALCLARFFSEDLCHLRPSPRKEQGEGIGGTPPGEHPIGGEPVP